jgi:hypothetical protein
MKTLISLYSRATGTVSSILDNLLYPSKYIIKVGCISIATKRRVL